MSFGQLLAVLRARARLILTITTAAVLVAGVVTLLWPKRYEATASVVIDPKGESPVWGAAMPPSMAENLVSTHLDLIASPAVALRVVEALGLEQKPDADALVAGSSPVGDLRAFVTGLFQGAPEEEAPTSRKDWLADQLLRNLTLKANRDSRVIRVTYSSPNRKFTPSVANAFVRAYRDTLLQLRVNPARQNAQWLDDQTKELKQRLEQAETRLAQFQRDKGILATDERMDLEGSRLTDLSAQLAQSQALSSEGRAKQQRLRAYLAQPNSADAPLEVLSNPGVQQLRQTIADREGKLGELGRRVGPNHPQYQAAVGEMQRLKRQLVNESRLAAQSALSDSGVAGEREASLRSALDQQRNKVLDLKSARGELAMLMREVDNAQRAYNATAERHTQTRLESEVVQTSVSSIVDSATVPARPASPKAALNIALAMAVGLAVAIGVALFLETMHRPVRSEADIAELLGIPVLAVLAPRVGGGQNILRLRDARFRRLAALPHRGANEPWPPAGEDNTVTPQRTV